MSTSEAAAERPLAGIRVVDLCDGRGELCGRLLADLGADVLRIDRMQPSGLGIDRAPRFDLLFLGMGADGHTASLFPHTEALHIDDRIVVANYVEKFRAHRITLTASTINRASNILFLVAGADKAPALQAVLQGPRDIETYPSQLIAPDAGTLTWMADEAAADRLTGAD